MQLKYTKFFWNAKLSYCWKYFQFQTGEHHGHASCLKSLGYTYQVRTDILINCSCPAFLTDNVYVWYTQNVPFQNKHTCILNKYKLLLKLFKTFFLLHVVLMFIYTDKDFFGYIFTNKTCCILFIKFMLHAGFKDRSKSG